MECQQWIITAADVKMPRLIYGTAWKKDRTADLVVQAVQAGFKGIDTACQPKHYDESLVGVALERLKTLGVKREALYLQTKFTPLSGQDPKRVPYDKDSPIPSQVIQSFNASKRNLQTHYVDSLVLHSPVTPHASLMQVWKAMEQIYMEGGARQLGISNCYNTQVMMQLYDEADVKPAVLQNRFYQETRYDADLRNWCSTHGVIYQSFWTITANRHILTSNTVRTIAQKYKKTEVQGFFRYLSQSGIIPLTGTCSEQHMSENLNIFDFELSSAELMGVSGLLRQR